MVQLTNREKEVLSLLSEGLSNSEIREKMGIKQPTLSSHFKNIYLKLGLDGENKKTKAAVWFLKNRG
ncbi:helix-turn-helix transcriptional regulator [bacterium]|nr:helix-turn-helix transcriptional regulator [bacterium]